MTKAKRYKRYSSEFKLEAIQRASEEGVTDKAVRNLSTTLRHRRFLFTDSFLLLWKWRVG